MTDKGIEKVMPDELCVECGHIRVDHAFCLQECLHKSDCNCKGFDKTKVNSKEG